MSKSIPNLLQTRVYSDLTSDLLRESKIHDYRHKIGVIDRLQHITSEFINNNDMTHFTEGYFSEEWKKAINDWAVESIRVQKVLLNELAIELKKVNSLDS